MRQPLRGQKCIRGDAERGVMMKPAPAPAFEVIEPQLVLQFLIVPFDPPAQHRELDQFSPGRRRRQRREPVLDRPGFRPRPLDQQPLLGPGDRARFVAMGGPHPDCGKARAHGAPRAVAPRHGPPGGRGELLGQGGDTERAMTARSAHQRRRPAMPAILRRGQRRVARRPDGGLQADADHIGNPLSRQGIAKRRHDAIAGIGDDGRGRDALSRQVRDLLERDLPFRTELDGIGHARRASTPAVAAHSRGKSS